MSEAETELSLSDRLQLLVATALTSLVEGATLPPGENVGDCLTRLFVTLLEEYVTGQGKVQVELARLFRVARHAEDPLIRPLPIDQRLMLGALLKNLQAMRKNHSPEETTDGNQSESSATADRSSTP